MTKVVFHELVVSLFLLDEMNRSLFAERDEDEDDEKKEEKELLHKLIFY